MLDAESVIKYLSLRYLSDRLEKIACELTDMALAAALETILRNIFR